MVIIKELRKKNGLKQSDLAKLLNTSVSNVSGWECGKWQPDQDTLSRLADFFRVSVDYLLGRTPDGYTETATEKLTGDEYDIITFYRGIPDDQKKVVYALLEKLFNAKA